MGEAGEFETSLVLIGALGFDEHLLSWFEEKARETNRLPHEVLRDVVEQAIESQIEQPGVRHLTKIKKRSRRFSRGALSLISQQKIDTDEGTSKN